MTFEEARAQFPVLARLAYLNAGSAGPLPRAAVEAARKSLERDLEEGRSGTVYIEDIREQRERIRSAIAAEWIRPMALLTNGLDIARCQTK